MDNNKHTPGNIKWGYDIETDSKTIFIFSEQHGGICKIPAEKANEEHEANAARIVETWNNYDDLKEQLETGANQYAAKVMEAEQLKADSVKWYGAYMECLKCIKELENEFSTFADIPHDYKKLKGWPGDENPRTLAMLKAVELIQKHTQTEQNTK